ncbi:MAG: cohesin domain-containing protein [bacterium]|nr:cohesin domain-containing protein [bacterium]
MDKKASFKIAASIFVSLFFIGVPVFAAAADLYFSPSSHSLDVGSSFSVKVQVSSPNQEMNAVSGVVSFPKDKLEVISLSKSASVINIWVQEPAFSNSAGTVNFEGIVLNPGFKGVQAQIITINFRAKSAGGASVSFLDASILANDGKGTNILSGMGTAKFNVSSFIDPEKEPAASQVAGTPRAPTMYSPTHPDPSNWYASSDATFQWGLPSDVTEVSFLLDTYPINNGEKLRGLVTSHTYKSLDDGIWYFHIKFKNKYGWGPATHFTVQIDKEKPRPIVLSFPHGAISLDNRPVALFNTTDSLSGIDYYEVKIGDKYTYQLLPDAVATSNPYVIPPQEPGNYSMKVLAYDKAGNFSEATGTFEIIALDLPQITSMPEKIHEGDVFRIVGRSYPTATVVAILKKDGAVIQEENAFTNALGQFTLVWPTFLPSGNYEMSLFVIDENGARSLPTAARPLVVEKKYVVNFGIVRLTLPVIIWLNIALFLLINALIGYWIYHFSRAKILFHKPFGEIESELDNLMVHLNTKPAGEDLKKAHSHVNASIAKIKKIIKDIHTL